MKKRMLHAATLVLFMTLIACGGPKHTAQVAPEDTIDYSKLITGGPKKRVAISKFVNKTAYGKGRLGTSASDKLSTHLVKSNAFIVIEREELGKVMGEQALGMSGAVSSTTAAKAGNLLGAQALIVGSISEFGYTKTGQDAGIFKSKKQTVRAVVDIRAIDTTTGMIVFAEQGIGEVDKETSQFLGFGSKSGYDETLNGKALNAAIVKVMSNLVTNLDKMEWSGKIAKVSDNGNVIINAGTKTGLTIGDVLNVSSLGEMIIDPDTGVAMGREPGNPKGKLEVASFFGADGALCKVKEGMGFERGDQVKLAD